LRAKEKKKSRDDSSFFFVILLLLLSCPSFIIVIDSSEIPINTNTYISDDTRKKPTIMNEHDQSIARTISSSSSEQLIPKEKQTGINETLIMPNYYYYFLFRHVLQSFW
jgi:hypothetical protein